jgi:hypothetical protein
MNPRLPHGFDTPVSIGHGGFGRLYRARQIRLDRHVVIKMLPVAERHRRDRLYHEARTHADIAIPGTPRIYDVCLYRRTVCIVMEWLRAVDLRHFLLAEPSPPARRGAAASLVHTVAALHARGFAHRDLKPSNVLLSPERGLYLIDFGMSRRADGPGADTSAAPAGTPRYIAPELLDASATEHDLRKADLYSLGVMLREVLGEECPDALVSALTAREPAERPAIDEVCRRREFTENEASTGRWREECEPQTALTTATRLVDGARELLRHGRFDEAYRLIVEAVGEVPDHPPAMALLQSFHATVAARRKKTMLIRAGLAAGAVAAAATLAFLLVPGRDHLPSAVMARSPKSAVVSLSTPSPAPRHTDEAGSGSYRLRMKPLRAVVGTVFVRLPHRDARLFVDGTVVPPGEGDRVRISLAGGVHRLSYVGDEGSVWTTHVRLMPFQTVHLSLPARGRETRS